MIHTEYPIEFAFYCAMKNRVWGVWACYFGPSPTGIFRTLNFRFQRRDGRADNFDFFPAKLPGFTSVRVQSCHRNSRRSYGSRTKKICKQQTNANNLRLIERARDLAQWKMRGNERDCDFPTVKDGLEGMLFIATAVQSAKGGAVWIKMANG